MFVSHNVENMSEITVAKKDKDEYESAETYSIDDAGQPGPKAWYAVNKRLLPVKGLYFTFIAGIGALIPFIPIYMKQLGLTSTETGILLGVVPFIAFFTQPLFGVISDKTRKPKLVLIGCFVCSGLFFALLLVTPKKRATYICREMKVIVSCVEGSVRFWDAECVLRTETSVVRDIAKLIKEIKQEDCSILCDHQTRANANIVNVSLLSLYNKSKSSVKINTTVSHGANTSISYGAFNQKSHFNENEYLSFLNAGNHCQIYGNDNTNISSLYIWSQICKEKSNNNCLLQCKSDEQMCQNQNTDSNRTFWIFSVLFLLGNIFNAPIVNLVDAIAYIVLAEERHKWGQQRLWGTLGFALFAMTSTFVMDILVRSNGIVDYSVAFYIFVGFRWLSPVIMHFLDVNENIHSQKMLKNFTALFRFPEVVAFLSVMTCLGILHFAYFGFLFWFLEDLGSSQIILGLCCGMNALSEVGILLVSGKIINLIGHVSCLYIALLAYVVRYLGYSFLTNAWLVLPIELLHGVSFGLMWAAATVYAVIIAPKGMSATVLGLMAGLYFGLGKGIAGVVTGKLFDSSTGIGERWSFRFYSFFAMFVLLVYAVTNIVIGHRRRMLKARTDAERKTEQGDNSIQLEPFLDSKV